MIEINEQTTTKVKYPDFFKSEWEDTVMRLNEIGIDLEEESKPLESEQEGGKVMREQRYDFGEIVSLNAALIIYAMGVQVVVEDGRYLRISKEEK